MSVAEKAYLAAWKRLDSEEQWLFEGFLAGVIVRESYEARWRVIDKAFAALEAKRIGSPFRLAA